MIEEEWLNSTSLWFLIDFAQQHVSERKLRRLICACCRRVAHLMRDDRILRALECAERLADQGAAGRRGRPTIERAAEAAVEEAGRIADAATDPAEYLTALARKCSAWAAFFAVQTRAKYAVTSVADHAALAVAYASCQPPPHRTPFTPDRERRMAEEAREQIQLMREIIGNPFRPVSLDPAWRTRAAVALARGMYEERRFDDMPLLGDALEEAGCTDAAVLSHCRQPGEHVRGCWVVDLVLGNE